jgi:hypothetical protein
LILYGNKDKTLPLFVSCLIIPNSILCLSLSSASLTLHSLFFFSFLGSKIADLKKKGYALVHQTGLKYDLEQPKLELQLNISQDEKFFNNGNSPLRVWDEILKNSSAVYLHTLILREDINPNIEITSKLINVRLPPLPLSVSVSILNL